MIYNDLDSVFEELYYVDNVHILALEIMMQLL